MAIAQRHMTLEEFLELPEEEPALEFEEGVVTQKVSPKGKHSRLQYALCELFNQPGLERKLVMAFPELRTTFTGRSYVPDVAVYRWERIPVDDSGKVSDDFREPPDVAIEVVSPEQSTNWLIRKCLWYVANGVRVALLVDPSDESVILFRPNRTPVGLHGQDQVDLGDVLPDFRPSVQEIFDSLKMR